MPTPDGGALEAAAKQDVATVKTLHKVKPGRPVRTLACFGCLVVMTSCAAMADDVLFEQLSSPLGLCGQSEILPTDHEVSTITAPFSTDGYRFTHWTINGSAERDVLGRALNPSQPFLLLEPTTAIAHYLSSSANANTNGIPDWWEVEFFGSLVSNGISDTDMDGFSLREEYRRDYHPSLTNDIRDGGFSVVFSPSSRLIANTNYFVYTRDSDPEGVLTTTESVLSNGTTIVVNDAYGASGGYSFAYWTLNGEVQRDGVGRSLSAFEFVLRSNTTVRAHYLGTTRDADHDGIRDWYEYNMHGTTNYHGLSDPDGDGFSLSEEYRRDYHPSITNDIRDGGFSVVFSPSARMVVDTNLSVYRRDSDPEGLMTTSESVLSNGTVITVNDAYGANGGYSFAYWTLNDEPQVDVVGRALSAFHFVLRSNTTARAHYVATGRDADGDGLRDWYELNMHGTTNYHALSDPDGDGFSLSEEYRRDYHPSVANDIRDGGFSVVFSPAISINLQFHPRVAESLFNGLPSPFFSADTSTTGTFAVTANSHPALGDWDGDGDLDLFVGGSNGVMRVFENKGSPVVMNWVERTSNFAAVASCWTNIASPAPALGDWSGDGWADLAVGGSTNGLWLVESPGSFAEGALTGALHKAFYVAGTTNAVPAFGDINADGVTELLVLTDSGAVHAYTNSALPAVPFASPPYSTDLLGTPVPAAHGLTTEDVNGDGVLDVLISDDNGNIWEFHGE